MPVTFTAIGPTLDATVVDTNLVTWQDLFSSGLLNADLAGTFSRYVLRRYQAGELIGVHTGANPFRTMQLGDTQGAIDYFDLTYRQGTEDPGLLANTEPRRTGGFRSAYAMEMLGRPGPSFYYTWQEEGLASTALAGVTGWPPTGWPPTRYPANVCYSRWLTVPGASTKFWLSKPAMLKVHAQAMGSLSCYTRINNSSVATAVLRDAYRYRWGLIVDSNPVLTTEWANTNPNILDPVTGAQAPNVSWQVVLDRTVNMAQRDTLHLYAWLRLQGGRRYNLRLAVRDTGHHGYVNKTTNTWQNGLWEESSGYVNAPVLSPYWTTEIAVAPLQRSAPPPWINLWESSGLDIEISYGRDNFATDSTDVEFTSIP